ncbi:MAG: c-type cytochrome [Sphingosinicella sp.]
MRLVLSIATAGALIVVAACQQAPETANDVTPDANRAEANQASNAPPALPPGTTPQQVAAMMHDRHERYEEIGKAFKGITRELKGDAPSLARVREQTALIARYAPQIVSWFPRGTGPETGNETRAKAVIWEEFGAFSERARAFETEMGRFQQVAQGNDVAAVRAAREPLAKACSNCHDRFRAPEEEEH